MDSVQNYVPVVKQVLSQTFRGSLDLVPIVVLIIATQFVPLTKVCRRNLFTSFVAFVFILLVLNTCKHTHGSGGGYTWRDIV